MYALCVSGAVNTQGLVWKFFFYAGCVYILCVWEGGGEGGGRVGEVLLCGCVSERKR